MTTYSAFRPARLLATGLAVSLLCSLAHARDWHVDAAHPDADDAGPGSAAAPLRSINAAAQQAEPGDVVRVHPGIYRERVMPARGGTAEAPIVYRSEVRHAAVVRGSDSFAPDWQAVEGRERVYRAALPLASITGLPAPYSTGPEIGSHAKNTPVRPVDAADAALALTLGQLFADGRPLPQVRSLDEVASIAGSWYVEADGQHLTWQLPAGWQAPGDGALELATRAAVFAPRRRGLAHIHVIGFTFEHGANQGSFPQNGIVSVRSGSHWRIEGNRIRLAGTIGLDIGSQTWKTDGLIDTDPDDQRLMIGGKHEVLDNEVTDNGLCGIAGWNCRGSRIAGNTVLRNNRLGFKSGFNAGWEEEAGIKLHACQDVVVEANYVADNAGAGIWFDNGFAGARISRNLVVGNLGKGIFLELGDGPVLIDTNIVAYTRRQSSFWAGHGIYAHDASGVTIAHNLLLQNAGHQVLAKVVTNRTLGADKHLVEASRLTLRNNIFAGSGMAAISLPYPSKLAQDNSSNYNLFLEAPTLELNSNSGRVKGEAIYAEMAARFAAEGRKLADWPTPQSFAQMRDLDLAGWQALAGWDTDSRVASGGGMLGHGVLQLKTISADWRVLCDPVPDCATDFYGRPMPAAAVFPGPFAALPDGHLQLPVIPSR